MRVSRFVFAATVAALLPATSSFSLDKGHQILLNRGVQSFALANTGDIFHLSKVQGANFTGVMWIWGAYDNSLLGPAPGINWSRWVAFNPNAGEGPAQSNWDLLGSGNMNDMPPVASPTNEAPYMSNCVSIALGDEQQMTSDTIRTNTVNWFNAVRDSYPNTILWTNSWGYELSDFALNDYIQRAKPDMLSMDTYEFVNDNSLAVAGSPSHLYNSLRQERAFGAGYGIPYQIYTQTYHASDGRRDPSDSELRLNYFAGIAFGCTSFANFRYGSGNTSLFTGNAGDTTTTPLYNTITDINAKLKKLSPALVRLKPRLNYISNIDAAMCYYPAQYLNGGTTTTLGPPEGDGDFKIYPTDYGTWFAHNNSDWASVSSSGTWRGMTVTNIGNRNNGLRGDVWMMWFTPLDESFDGSSYNNEEYIMILNGLSDPTGSGADCTQNVQLNLIAQTKTQHLLVLNQQTGNVDSIATPAPVSGRTLPAFQIAGGEMVLFKYDDGAPFVGFVPTAADNWELFD